MRKTKLLVIIILCIMAFTASFAIAEKGVAIVLELPQIEPLDLYAEVLIQESKFPASAEIIENEAFEGTALVKIELPNTVIRIGERAFADILTLRDISIPLTTRYIDSTAFDGSNRMTITAPVNSYARAYAKNHGLHFSPIVMFCASMQMPSISALSNSRSTHVVDTVDKTIFNPETQWRRIEEINVVKTEELIANHVQGRSPPMV